MSHFRVIARSEIPHFILQSEPRPHDCRKLAGYDGPGYRVDQGEYRILYEVDDQAQHVTVFLIGHRKDIYERLERLELAASARWR